ncbi:hypothetical protein MA16_Dca027937 [Dendrobium catenatum]|uniref:Uncharacterized protein n=1 Tax=Dendrobium catenatum TaxID=906689 RepID=A0A2I0V6P9_9ASPA|nr:hypothetical protein MA16_Dca027937 [Dendrobium catenatum]
MEEAKRLGLKEIRGGGSIKAVNSAARPIHGIARGVKTTMDSWSGTLDFSIIPMNDFKIVLGLKFLDQVKAFSIPHANNMCIMEGKQACMVPSKRAIKQEKKMLSAIQFKKGVKQDEESYLAILRDADKEEKPQEDMSKEVAVVLEEFKDIARPNYQKNYHLEGR